jgi:hypothetical protein
MWQCVFHLVEEITVHVPVNIRILLEKFGFLNHFKSKAMLLQEWIVLPEAVGAPEDRKLNLLTGIQNSLSIVDGLGKITIF